MLTPPLLEGSCSRLHRNRRLPPRASCSYFQEEATPTLLYENYFIPPRASRIALREGAQKTAMPKPATPRGHVHASSNSRRLAPRASRFFISSRGHIPTPPAGGDHALPWTGHVHTSTGNSYLSPLPPIVCYSYVHAFIKNRCMPPPGRYRPSLPVSFTSQLPTLPSLAPPACRVRTLTHPTFSSPPYPYRLLRSGVSHSPSL